MFPALALRQLFPYLIGIGLAGAAVVFIYKAGYKNADEKWKSKWNDQVAIHEKAIAEAESAESEKEIYWLKEIDKVRNDAQKIIDSKNADLANSNSTGERLRKQVSGLAAAARKECPGAGSAAGGSAADTAIDLLADMSAGFDEAAREISQFADESRNAGIACQKSYNIIKNPL